MKPFLISLFIIASLFLGISSTFAAPTGRYEFNLWPVTTNTYELGTSTLKWYKSWVSYASTTQLSADSLCLNSDTCRTTWPTGGSGSVFAWTPTSYGVSTSTTLGFLNGFLSTASSTINSNLIITGNSTTTNATTTQFHISSIFNFGGDVFSDLLGSGFTNSAGTLTCATGSSSVFGCLASADWTTFNAKESALTFSTGLSRSVNTITVNQAFTPTWTGAHIFDNITRSTTTQATTTNLAITRLTSALVQTSADGSTEEYAGTSCTNQFPRSLSVLGIATCASVANTDLVSSTISGVALGGTLFALTNDATLNGSSYTGTAAISDWGLNLANPNTWTGGQIFGNATATQATSTNFYGFTLTGNTLSIGGTASTTINNAGALTVMGSTTLQRFVATHGTTTNATSTNLAVSNLTSALILSGADGSFAEYTGTTCTNQFVRVLSVLGAATCATVGAADVALANLTATNATLTFSGTYDGSTARTIGLNLGNTNTWTAAQIFDSITRSTTTSATTTNLFSTTASSTNLFSSAVNFGSSILAIVNGTLTGLGIWDLGGATSFEVPNGTAPVFSAIGQIGYDTSDKQLLIATTTTDTPGVLPLTQKLWSATIASTSPDFVSGGRIWMPPQRDGFSIQEIHCAVDAGTSVVINVSNSAGTTDSETVTCAATVTSDISIGTNPNYAAGSLNSLEIGTITGTVDYLTFAIYGVFTRE